jgi:predicted transcriptional regulator
MCSTSVLHFASTVSTTTIRLPHELKARVAAAAKRAGKSAHSFILEAIAEKADQEQRRSDFHDVAETRYSQIAASGRAIPWSEMRAYLENRVAGKKVRRPVAKKLSR